MQAIDLTVPQGAIFSEDGKYRYVLWRVWDLTLALRLVIALNPSKANHIINDPTITRSVVRADRDGFGGLLFANIYALKSTDPKRLLEEDDVIGVENDEYLKLLISMAMASGGQVVCAWGSFAPVAKRAPDVLKMIPEPYCLGVNADGNPKHPLYISYKTQVVRYGRTLHKE